MGLLRAARKPQRQGNVLLLTDGYKPLVHLSARNLPGVQVRPFGEESTYDLLWADTLIIEGPRSSARRRWRMRDPRQVILRPVVTEASADAAGGARTYTFIVAKDANKIEIRNAVRALFDVKVEDVRTANYPGKVAGSAAASGRKSGYKKALVKLVEGDSIDVYEGV
jgi:large subunit ribosomal protein L23